MCLHDGASDSSSACHDDFGKEGTSRGGSRLVFHSSSLAVCNFSDSVVVEITVWLVFTADMALFVFYVFPFFEISFLERVTAPNPKGFPPTNPFRHQYQAVTMMLKERQRDNA